MKDATTGWTEADIVINGHKLTFAESMTLRVAIGSFRIGLSDKHMREGIGEMLAHNYDKLAATIEKMLLDKE